MGWKIVRDLNKKQLEGKISGAWRTSPDPVSALVKKVGEEYSEFVENRDPGELYDMLDVIEALIQLLDPDGKHEDKHQVKCVRFGYFGAHLEWHPAPSIELGEK